MPNKANAFNKLVKKKQNHFIQTQSLQLPTCFHLKFALSPFLFLFLNYDNLIFNS